MNATYLKIKINQKKILIYPYAIYFMNGFNQNLNKSMNKYYYVKVEYKWKKCLEGVFTPSL